MDFDIKIGTLKVTSFILLKAKEDYLFARGWAKFSESFYQAPLNTFNCNGIVAEVDNAILIQQELDNRTVWTYTE